MDSPQSALSSVKGSLIESTKPNANDFGSLSREINVNGKGIPEVAVDFDGVLEVYIHEAREIHNICIYQKQDVYAKFSLTNDPENAVSTKIIHGGGHNPVFNEYIRLDVGKVDSSLKCEIWMLSRVRNYLEDQLLGFALVPVSEILFHNGKLEKEFSLTSTDLFHSPAGFVQLSVAYSGSQPDVIHIPSPAVSEATDSVSKNVESLKSLSSDLEKIEFPDLKVVNDNHQMVEEYLAMPSSALDSKSSENLVGVEIENQASSVANAQPDESESVSTLSSKPNPKIDSPLEIVSTNGASPDSLPASSQSCEAPNGSKSPNDHNSKDNCLDTDSNASAEQSGETFVVPVINVNIEPEPKVVQQDFVDMYMKSMQQFTESLAKMKLPMDFENGPTSSENSNSDQKSPSTKNSGTSRVFYGSRAFF